jgi:hypothetical protein
MFRSRADFVQAAVRHFASSYERAEQFADLVFTSQPESEGQEPPEGKGPTLLSKLNPFAKIAPVLLFALLLAGCHKQVTAPVPGSINTIDAYAFRAISDAQAVVTSFKTWEACSDQKFPASVTFDGATWPCDPGAGAFPARMRPLLYQSETAYNVALAAGQAYHSGASNDANGLENALNSLSQAITALLTSVKGGK